MMNPISDPRSDAPAGDLTALLRLRKWGGDQLISEMWELFRADVPRHIAGARHAASQGDWPATATAAHSMRGSSAQLGSARMSDLCAAIERHALAADTAPILPLLDALELEFAAFSTWLNAITGRPASPDHV